VIVYSKSVCPFCVQAKNLLKSKGILFTEINIEEDSAGREYLVEQSLRSVPQIFKGDLRIGGFNELKTWLELKEQTL
jgi:glutaredoxin 3